MQGLIFDQTIISIWRGQHIVSPFYFCSKVWFLGKTRPSTNSVISTHSPKLTPSEAACLSQEELILQQQKRDQTHSKTSSQCESIKLQLGSNLKCKMVKEASSENENAEPCSHKIHKICTYKYKMFTMRTSHVLLFFLIKIT